MHTQLSFFILVFCFFNALKLEATVYTVSNLSDAGAGSFRQALTSANGTAGTDIIEFSLSGAIDIFSVLPQITDSLVINGHPDGNSIRRTFTNPSHRIFDIANGSHVVVNKLTLFGGSIITGNGAGILIQSNCIVELNGCCIRNCFANTTSMGGGIFVESQAKLTMTNCTLSDNSMSSAGGGGMVCDSGSDVTIVNCTFSHNTAGAILNYAFNLKMTNTILANSMPASTADFTNDGGSVSINNNNIVELCAAGTACNVFFSNNDPGLGNLTINNSGPTETRSIGTSSIAYNAGTTVGAPTTDQNDTPRDSGPDIGAYEVPGALGIEVFEQNDANQCSSNDLGTFNLQIVDLSGRIVLEKQYDEFWQTQEDMTNFETNNGALHKGIYILRLASEQKICTTKMIHAY